MKRRIELVEKCDKLPYFRHSASRTSTFTGEHALSRLLYGKDMIGYIRAPVLKVLRDHSSLFAVRTCQIDFFAYDIDLVEAENGADSLSEALARVVRQWRDEKRFKVLEGWRDELYDIYGGNGQIIFRLERAACALFGLVTYGAHLNTYIAATETTPMRMWCPRRSMTKATFPGLLDNSVAGGISNGLSPYETIIKESDEEASIPESVARKLIKAAGAISYIYIDGKAEDGEGWIQPEVQYVYDLPLTGDYADLKLRPNDGESEDFELWTMDKVEEEMMAGHFKPNCAAVILDFMMRHGLVTPENEPDYLRIQQRLHRRFDLPVR